MGIVCARRAKYYAKWHRENFGAGMVGMGARGDRCKNWGYFRIGGRSPGTPEFGSRKMDSRIGDYASIENRERSGTGFNRHILYGIKDIVMLQKRGRSTLLSVRGDDERSLDSRPLPFAVWNHSTSRRPRIALQKSLNWIGPSSALARLSSS